MRKIVIKRVFLTLTIVFILLGMCTSCRMELYFDSLEEYRKGVEAHGIGNSNTEIDIAFAFLPSQTFISDYVYTDGGYHYYEDSRFWLTKPEKSFLWLRYSEDVYLEAKAFMLEKIPNDDEDHIYPYGDYVFYLNFDMDFPLWFTMACYNDTNCTLMFIGFYIFESQDEGKEHKWERISDWENFIDTYYGEYYDFSK